MGAVDVSPDGGFLHRSVFGGADRVKEPNDSGTASSWILRGVKEELAGGMASVMHSTRSQSVSGDQRSALVWPALRVVLDGVGICRRSP
jgi:hypothetical protein